MADIEKTGDWDGFAAILAKASSQFKSNIKKATDTSGRLLEGKIVQRIQSGQVAPPTGEKFRAWKEAHGFSGDTLIMTSSLLNAIKYENKAWNEGFVGVNRNAQSKDGVSLVSLAAVHEFGDRSGKIPKRPYIRPVIEQTGSEIGENYQKAIEETFKK